MRLGSSRPARAMMRSGANQVLASFSPPPIDRFDRTPVGSDHGRLNLPVLEINRHPPPQESNGDHAVVPAAAPDDRADEPPQTTDQDPHRDEVQQLKNLRRRQWPRRRAFPRAIARIPTWQLP